MLSPEYITDAARRLIAVMRADGILYHLHLSKSQSNMRVNEPKSQMSAASQPSDQQITPSDDIAISVKSLTKTYRIFGHPGDRIKQALTLGRVCFHREFTPLRDVSFEIK